MEHKLLLVVPFFALFSIFLYDNLSISDPLASKSEMSGVFYIYAYDSEGNLKAVRQSHNLVVTEGENTAADLLFPDINFNSNATDNKFDVVGIGTSSTAPADTQTDILGAIGGCARQQDGTIDGNAATTGTSARVRVMPSFSGNNCAGAIVEAGIFNSITGGEMLARNTFSAVNLDAGDTLTVEYNFTISDDGV